MYSYSYVPPRNAKKASAVVTACFICGLGLMLVSGFIPYKFIAQIIGIAILAVGLFIATRYIIRTYAYAITKVGEGDYDLVINQVQGGKATTVCRVNMDEIRDFYNENGGKKPDKSIKRFDYVQNLGDKGAFFIEAELREGKAAIRFSPDEKMAEIIETLRPKDLDFAAN